MKSSEEMTKRVLLRLEQEKQRASAKRENRRKGAIRLLTTACCLSLLIGLLLLWPHRDGSGSFFAFAVSQREPSAETNAMEDAAAAPEETGEFCAEPTAPAETSEPTEASEPPEQTAPTNTAEPESWLLTAPADREHQFSLVQLTLENGKVVRHLILAGSGEPVLEDLPLAGLTPEEAFPVLLQPLVEAGYISGDPDSAPVLMLAAYDRNGYDKNGNLYEVVERDGLGALISTALAEQGITQRILERDQTDGEYAQQLEQLYGASTEHFMPALEQVRQARKAALEENSGRVIAELFALDVTRELVAPKYQIGDYDQYGELIRYGAGTEPPAPARSLEDMSEEERRILESIYSPEDLAMMLRERTWTTMTNVVGMHEDEAGALLRSRGIVPRVCYENNEEYRAKGFTDGQVFMQDTSAGKRINSDSHVLLWVMAQTEPERNGLSQGWHPEEAAQPLDCIGEPEGNWPHVMEAWTGGFSEEKLKAAIQAYPGKCDAFEGSVNMISFTADFAPVSCSVTRLAAVNDQDISEELKGYIDLAVGCSIQGQKVLVDTGWWLDHASDWTQNHSRWAYLVRLMDANGREHYYYFRVNYVE